MGTNRLKWPSTLNLVGIKNSPAKFFSQSLSQQAKRAMLLALVPIVILTLWYAQQVAQHQQETNHIYHKNQSLVLSFNTLKGDISALEKAHLNNQLLNNAQLQKSIEEKWQVTNKRIEFLKKSHVSEQIVAKWQQLQNLAPKTHVLNVDYAKLQQQLLKLEQPLHKAIEDSLSQQAIAFSTLNQYFLAGLFLFIPLLIVISLIVIRKVTNQLNALERVILQLGEGNFAKPITLHGSEEFVALGKELDWLREELHLSHKQKDTFLRHVSHELKTPLASLTEGNSLLQSDSFGTVTKAQQRIINIMDGALSRLATLIDDLLNYSAANHPLSQQLYSFDQIKLELIKHFEQQINDSRLRIHWNHEDSAPLLPYLPIKLILTQLLGNALQYAHSHIEIHSHIEQEQVQLSVIDDGPGIDLSEQHKLMQPFYRGKHSEQHNGSGLGLAIVAECVKQLHGTVKWQHAQTGSHICIQFPIQRELSNA
ncbi:Adaptive-response sensory-kinase SasA [Pseudoalteromonas holothuriae]|uniref:histidine kinase n=1 Tax=Pseudoalteromonas holothuriae TaxID=2963714 RepID=A0ABN8UFJ8_9GAMM|nr:HAMP domain-containing sensor histidine kinase [Pseudoalteromonas sp. CIP111951]CAH9049758.1 Adaptive-response sensory-kinase SasA [Pseudoalteromonas sp. CIP111951]